MVHNVTKWCCLHRGSDLLFSITLSYTLSADNQTEMYQFEPQSDPHLVHLLETGDVEQLRTVFTVDNVNQLFEKHHPIGRLCFSPLCFAIFYGHRDVVKVCLQKGACVEACSYRVTDNKETLYTPLLLAAMYGHCHIIEDLVTAGADVNALVPQPHDPGKKVTVLEVILSRSPDKALVTTLLRSGAQAPIETASAEAVKSGDFSVMLLLLQESHITCTPQTSTILMMELFEETAYCYTTRRRVVEILTESGSFRTLHLLQSELISVFQLDVFRRNEHSEWMDNVYESHLGEILTTTGTRESDSDSDSDSSDDEDVICSECTEEKTAELCKRAPNLDPDTVQCFGLCWMRHFMTRSRTPQRLKSMCRNVIRARVGPVKMVPRLAETGLPRELQEYVLFRVMY